MSIGLAIIGNPKDKGFSEMDAWRSVADRAERLLGEMGLVWDALQSGGQVARMRAPVMVGHMQELRALAEIMRQQLGRDVHVNPRRNPGRGHVMSDSVQAIVYVHKDDGQFYIHPFGGKEASDADLALLARMRCFTGKSRVRMIAEPDGGVSVEGKDGQNLWEEF
ncbi:MAG: hypothetical protein WC729_30025 [Sphingomonas sp.]|uniref:hypothetical protein n=1 Tax=Sphingomonas sp. TaxID=28214 RepID=UPI0035635391